MTRGRKPLPPEVAAERKRQRYRDWYHKHKDEVNKRRRAKLRENEELREHLHEYHQNWRHENREHYNEYHRNYRRKQKNEQADLNFSYEGQRVKVRIVGGSEYKMTPMDFDLGPLYKAGFKDGADSVIEKVSKWLDPDTIAELKESYKE